MTTVDLAMKVLEDASSTTDAKELARLVIREAAGVQAAPCPVEDAAKELSEQIRDIMRGPLREDRPFIQPITRKPSWEKLYERRHTPHWYYEPTCYLATDSGAKA